MNDINKQYPKHFYHYTSIEAAKSILKERKLLPSKILNCNDLFEIDISLLYIQFKNDRQLKWFCNQVLGLYNHGNSSFRKDISELIQLSTLQQKEYFLQDLFFHYKKKLDVNGLLLLGNKTNILSELRDTAYVYCFSAADISSNVLMWAHYAKSHKGVALEFSFPSQSCGKELNQVAYPLTNLRGGIVTPHQIMEIFSKGSEAMQHFFKKALLTKSLCWKYEKEWRIISFIKDSAPKPAIVFQSNFITSVYLGLNVTENDKNELINILTESYPNARCYKATKNPLFIKLDFQDMF